MYKRVKITFSYDGSKFFGSQIQNGKQKATVMGVLQEAFRSLHVNNIPQASGRTDKGVHALNQVFHIDIPHYCFDLDKLKRNLNHMIMPFIYIKQIKFTTFDFHARFSAKKRLYRYIVSHDKFNPFLANYCVFLPELDANVLNQNAKEFIGKHDFKYFKKQGSITKNDTRMIYQSGAYRYKSYTILYFLGNSFLRSQIRMMCSFLFKIEKKSLNNDDLRQQLNLISKIDTSLVPAHGLYLSKIYY